MKKKLSFANKKRLLQQLLLLFVLLIGPFLFDVHPPGKFSGYGPVQSPKNLPNNSVNHTFISRNTSS